MSFLIDEAILTGPAFSELPDGAARLLLRAASYCAAHEVTVITANALRLMLGTRRQAEELVSAGFWVEGEKGWEVPYAVRPELSSKRAEAGRAGGIRSAEARRRKFGSAQPGIEREAKHDVGSTPETGVASPSHTLPLLSLSGSSAFSALSEPLSSLQLSSEGPDPLPARGHKKPKLARWRRVPSDWEPTADHLRLAVSLNVDLQLEQAKFRDHEFEKPKSDPDATFRNWLRNAKPSQRPLGEQTTARKYASSDDIDSMLGLS